MTCAITLSVWRGRNTAIAADQIRECLIESGFSVDLYYFGSSKLSQAKGSLEVIVFPIMGDNRLPEVVEQYLIEGDVCDRAAVCILGDYLNVPPGRCAVAEESLRLLELRRIACFWPPLLLDTPFDSARSNAALVSRWLGSFTSDLEFARQQGDLFIAVKPDIAEPALADLLRIVPGLSYKLNAQGRCSSVSLAAGTDYPRSLVGSATRKRLESIWTHLDHLESLAELKLPFAGLHEWPCHTPNMASRLQKLDARGNRFCSHSFLSDFQDLVWLNISDNNLTEIPREIFGLEQLRTLLAYKNRIEHIDKAIGKLRGLRRLSLYRNFIVEVPEELVGCRELQRLNVGANPLKRLPDLLALPALRELILRNSAIAHLQVSFESLSNLAVLDVTKTDLNMDSEERLQAKLPRTKLLIR